jgi:hypothetical protein
MSSWSQDVFEEYILHFTEIHRIYKEWIESKDSTELYPECVKNPILRNYILTAPRLDHKPPYASRLACILFKENFRESHQKYTSYAILPYHLSTLERVAYNDSRERACVQYRKFIRTLQKMAVDYERMIPSSPVQLTRL